MFNKFSERIVSPSSGFGGVGVPDGGTTGQHLSKASNADGDVIWETPPSSGVVGIPPGGTTNQALLKLDGTDYNADWADVVTGPGFGVPPGGTTGQHLAKQSGTDGDVIWEDPPTFSLGPVIPNAIVLGDTSSTVTSLASLGTTATVLHGNAAGAPSWGAVDLASEITGNLSVSHLDSGSSATSSTFWRGDGSWAEPPTIGTSTDVSVSSANYIQNSSFQVRNRATQSSIDLVNGTVTFVANRWSVLTYADNIRSIIDSSNAQDCLTIKRYAGSDNNSIQIIQIFDTEDSLKLLNHTWVVSFEVKAKAVLLEVDSFDAFVTSGEDVDGSLADYLSHSWTNGTTQGSSVTQYAINPTWTYFQFQFNLDSSSYPDVKQLAIEFQFFFASSSPDATNDELSIRNVIWSSRYADTRTETKSLAVTKRECNRYHQNLDLYLTDAIINIPINMREIPAITLDPADSFTSTGTSKDVLVIQLDSSADNGMHTVYLDCEL